MNLADIIDTTQHQIISKSEDLPIGHAWELAIAIRANKPSLGMRPTVAERHTGQLVDLGHHEGRYLWPGKKPCPNPQFLESLVHDLRRAYRIGKCDTPSASQQHALDQLVTQLLDAGATVWWVSGKAAKPLRKGRAESAGNFYWEHNELDYVQHLRCDLQGQDRSWVFSPGGAYVINDEKRSIHKVKANPNALNLLKEQPTFPPGAVLTSEQVDFLAASDVPAPRWTNNIRTLHVPRKVRAEIRLSEQGLERVRFEYAPGCWLEPPDNYSNTFVAEEDGQAFLVGRNVVSEQRLIKGFKDLKNEDLSSSTCAPTAIQYLQQAQSMGLTRAVKVIADPSFKARHRPANGPVTFELIKRELWGKPIYGGRLMLDIEGERVDVRMH